LFQPPPGCLNLPFPFLCPIISFALKFSRPFISQKNSVHLSFVVGFGPPFFFPKTSTWWCGLFFPPWKPSFFFSPWGCRGFDALLTLWVPSLTNNLSVRSTPYTGCSPDLGNFDLIRTLPGLNPFSNTVEYHIPGWGLCIPWVRPWTFFSLSLKIEGGGQHVNGPANPSTMGQPPQPPFFLSHSGSPLDPFQI